MARIPEESGHTMFLQLGEELLHAIKALFYIVVRYGVGEANVLVGAEGLAGNGDHVGFVKQAGGQLGGGL